MQSTLAWSSVKLVFLTSKNRRGVPTLLEPGGRFSHIALVSNDSRKFLHVHPSRGVEWSDNLSELGVIAEIIELPFHSEIKKAQIEPFMGLPYDHSYSWESPNSSYCSKLIGQLLNLQPVPMRFDTIHWKPHMNLPRGGLGLSPDDIYQILVVENHLERPPLNSCVPSFKR